MKMYWPAAIPRLILRRVAGHSMEPTLNSGKIIICKKQNDFEMGDVVVANVDGHGILKRLLETKGDEVHLAGDNHGHDAGHDAGWHDKNNVIAKVVWPKV